MTLTKTSFFERLVTGVLSVIPRSIVRRVARRYVAGETLAHAIDRVRQLNLAGACATIDILGEEVIQREQAEWATSEYCRLLKQIASHGLDANISIKPTLLGLRIDEQLCLENVRAIATCACQNNNFVRLDMEDHTCTDATLRIYRQLQPSFRNLGVVLQARLFRTKNDVQALVDGEAAIGPLNVRLCKGIYREPESIAHQNDDQICRSFEMLLRTLVARGADVGVATHHDRLIEYARNLFEEFETDPEHIEFQMLLGVLPKLRNRLIEAGYRVRIYVPYGEDWYAYSMRRIQENPAVAAHAAKALMFPG